MKTLLEFLPLVVFFVVFKTVDIYWATASLIGTSALQIAYHYFVDGVVQKKHLIFFVIVLVFGTLTIAFQDDNFIKWKVTVINALFSIGILLSTFGFKKNPIQAMLSAELELPKKIWNNIALAWAGFFAFCAGLNIYIAFNFSQEVWVNFKVFGLMGLTLAFTFITILVLYPHLPKDEDGKTKTIDK